MPPACLPPALGDLVVEVDDPRTLSAAEQEALMVRCRKGNMAIYASRLGETEGTGIPRSCGLHFGLQHLDHNRGAESDPAPQPAWRDQRVYRHRDHGHC